MRAATKLLLPGAVALSIGAGCRSLPEPRDVPAVVTEPSAESRAELKRVLSEALHGAPVTIADDALTETSLLTIERQRPRDAEGRQLSGRDLDRPHQFRLVSSDSRCVLVQQPDGPRWELTETTCAPE